MSLSSEEIVRFSRQILLSEVGGIGQERLLQSELIASGASPSLAVAAAYVSSGGSSLQGPKPSRFLSFGESRQASSKDTMALGVLAEGGTAKEAASSSFVVVVGYRGTRAVVLFKDTSGCEECFRRSVHGLTDVHGADDVLLGTLGAFVYQLLSLQKLRGAGAIAFSVEEGFVSHPMDFCSKHGGAT